MPKKPKPTDQDQELLETGAEQQAAGENPADTPTEKQGAGESGAPDDGQATSDAGMPPDESEVGSGEHIEDSGAFEGEPDPALDPSLVIPTLPPHESPHTGEPEDSSGEPEAPTPERKGKGAASSELAAPKRTAAAVGGNKRKEAAVSSKKVVAIDDEVRMQSDEEREAYLWMELRNSLRSKRILTGILGGVERSPNGNCTAVVYYKDQRVVIPASEMLISIVDELKTDNKLLNNRYSQILTRSLGAQIDFIVIGIDKRSNSVAASRKEAMIRKQQNFYLPTARNRTPLISEGQVVEARVISVGDKNMRVEVFGVETSIVAREVAWEWVDDCNDYYRIGDRVLVKILRIDTSDRQDIRINASIRESIVNPAQENIKKCTVQGKYIGKVTGVDKRAIYVRLNVGVNAIAIGVHDRKAPCRKDDVSFVITRIDKEAGVAIGIITKVIKQFV